MLLLLLVSVCLTDCAGTRAQSVSAGGGRKCLSGHRVLSENGGVFVHVYTHSVCSVSTFLPVQSKLSDLDSRLSQIAEEEKSLRERLAVLTANADKLNPKNKTASTETLR